MCIIGYLKLKDYQLGSIKSKSDGPEGCLLEPRAQATTISYPGPNFLSILAQPGSVNLVLDDSFHFLKVLSKESCFKHSLTLKLLKPQP